MRSPDDAALIGRDRRLPGLPLLLDDDAFAGALRTSCPGVKIDAVESRYIRYKPATSVLVGYRVRLDATTIGVHACGFAGAAEHRLRDAQRGASTPGPLGPGVLVLPEPMIVVRTFPNDRRLGSLRRLGDDARRAALLRRLLPEHEHLWTGDVRPLRHKPERRFVGAIEAGGEPRAVIRMYTPDDFGRGGKHDIDIFREGLKQRMPRGKLAVVDRGYVTSEPDEQMLSQPNHLGEEELEAFKSRVRLRHETFNGRLNFFAIISNTFTHGTSRDDRFDKHQLALEAVCVTVQYQMDNGSPIFEA